MTITDGISSIKDVELFISFYQSQISTEVDLYSIDLDTGELSCKSLIVPRYEKIRALQHFLLNRDYNSRGPLIGIHLENNGFGDLLGSPLASEIVVTDWFHNNIDQYAISRDSIISAGILSSRLIRMEVIHTLLPHLKKGERYKYNLDHEPMFITRQENITRCYSEFMQFANSLSESHPYAHVIRAKYAFDEFFPKTYICINGRPFIVLRQGNMGSLNQDARSLPCYDIMDSSFASSLSGV